MNMNYFSDLLKKAEDAKIEPWELLTATEVDVFFPELSAKDFEKVADFVYAWIMETDATPGELCNYIARGLETNNLDLSMFHSNEGWKKATKYINSII